MSVLLSVMVRLTDSLLPRLWPSRGLAECVGDGVAKGWAEFLPVGGVGRGDETLFAPEFAADGSEGVGEGWLPLAIPGACGCGPAGPGRELRNPVHDDH
jgi:hypothetical protein